MDEIKELKKKLEDLKSETGTREDAIEKINLLNKLARLLHDSAPFETEDYSRIALALGKKFNLKSEMSDTYSNLGLACWIKGNWDKAMEYHLKALKIRKEAGDKEGVAKCYVNMGIIYYSRSNYKKALEYYLKALHIFEEIGDKDLLAKTYNNIGNLYWFQNDYEHALDYQHKSLIIREELGNKHGIAGSYNNIGGIYQSKGDYHKALEYHLKALKIREELKDKAGLAKSYSNIGGIFTNQEKYGRALEYNLKSLKINEEIGDKRAISQSYINIGETQIYLQNYDGAFTYFNKSLQIAQEIGAGDLEMNNYKNLYKLYEVQKDYEKALNYYKLYISLKDVLFNEEKSKQIAEMRTKYETEKKDKETQLARSQAEIYRLKTVELQKMVEQQTEQLRVALAREKELNELKTHFIEITSHEFRTPLAIIAATADIIENYSHKLPEEKIKSKFINIKKSISYLTELLDEALFMNNLNCEDFKLLPGKFNLKTTCQMLIEMIQLQNKRNQRIIFFCGDFNPYIRLDERMFNKVLGQLLLNAAKFSPENSDIYVKVEFYNNTFMISITDQGIGIAKDYHQNIFEPYVRANNAGTVPGIGLGLAIVRRLVEMANGRISVESEGVGKGSTFILEFPKGIGS